MKITVIAVGRLREKYLKEGIAEYTKRLSRFCEFEIIEVEDEQVPDKLSPAQEELIKKREAERILKRIKDGTALTVLDIKGESLDSEGFAARLEAFFVSGSSNITFIIGGSIGLDANLIKTANFRFSLSKLTFPHQLTRLILLEQLFRAFKIIHGETYHK